jgi:cyclopropane-fatty-acyl-phospholipid synthase
MSSTPTSLGARRAAPAHRKGMPFAARKALAFLERLDSGRLHVGLPDGTQASFGPGGLEADIEFHDWSAFGRILRDGDIGFAEGFLDGQWDSPHLPMLLTLLAANRAALDKPLYGSLAGRLVHRIVHLLRSNTRGGSRRNIAAHYDLGNAFYALWLDPGMTYSSALFGQDPAQSLHSAQQAKYRRILDALAPAPGSRILEIGCGWGGFAEMAAAEQCHVTGLTLSREQLEYARQRLAGAGHAERCALEFRDYRDIREQYDAVVSIEMVEAVGERWWPAYFERVAGALPRGGKAVVQSITIDEALFERYRRGSDFIQQYVFPGGMLPTRERFRDLAAQAGLRTVDEFCFGADYARTLACWRERFLAQSEAVRALGFDERFLRLWDFYLSYCEAGFSAGSTDVVHFTFERQ